MAQIGHYPLFFSEWLFQSVQGQIPGRSLTLRKADLNVKKTFEALARHHGIEKKKTALIGMDKNTREEFIRSFIKIVEREVAKRNKNLQ